MVQRVVAKRADLSECSDIGNRGNDAHLIKERRRDVTNPKKKEETRITHRFPLNRIEEAFGVALRQEGIKVVVES